MVISVSVPKKWSKKKTLGKGAFGEVYCQNTMAVWYVTFVQVFLVCDDDNGRPLAMKAVEVPSQTSSVNVGGYKHSDHPLVLHHLLKGLVIIQ